MTSWHEYHQYELENGGMDDHEPPVPATPRCLCGHVAHGNIGGCGACRTHGCPCPQFHDQPIPDKCECDVCWRESNMPPAGVQIDPL